MTTRRAVRAGDGSAACVCEHGGTRADERIRIGLGRLEAGSERSVIVVPSPVAARILAAARLGGREAAIRMSGRRLVDQVEADQERQADHDDARPDRDVRGDACRGIRSLAGGVAVETDVATARPGRTRHNAPAPRPTSVKTIGSAKAW